MYSVFFSDITPPRRYSVENTSDQRSRCVDPVMIKHSVCVQTGDCTRYTDSGHTPLVVDISAEIVYSGRYIYANRLPFGDQ